MKVFILAAHYPAANTLLSVVGVIAMINIFLYLRLDLDFDKLLFIMNGQLL